MSGYGTDVEQIRAHARNVEAVMARFAAVKAASTHIARDESAYGLLCGWISGVLEDRHVVQDELLADVEENLKLVAEELRATATDYEETDAFYADAITKAGGGVGE